MSVKSKPYFWIVCDHEGCDARSPSSDAAETDGITAWEDEAQAFDSASGGDWMCKPEGQDFCLDHWPDDEDDQVLDENGQRQ